LLVIDGPFAKATEPGIVALDSPESTKTRRDTTGCKEGVAAVGSETRPAKKKE
jgi:hypothetical protein